MEMPNRRWPKISSPCLDARSLRQEDQFHGLKGRFEPKVCAMRHDLPGTLVL